MDPIVLIQMGPAYDRPTLRYFQQRLEMDRQITSSKIEGIDALPHLVEEAKEFEGHTGERGLFLEQGCRRNGQEREHLTDVEATLKRLDDGIFGWCLGPNCVMRIPIPRLDAIPTAKYCVDCHAKNTKNKRSLPQTTEATKRSDNPLGIYQVPTMRKIKKG